MIVAFLLGVLTGTVLMVVLACAMASGDKNNKEE